MKPNLLLSVKIILFIIIASAVQSCSNEIGAWKNDKIKSGVRDDLHQLDDQAFKYLYAYNTKKLGELQSQGMIDDRTADAIIQRVSHELRQDSFVRVDEYYTVNKYMTTDTIEALNEGINSHRLVYPGLSQEMYISIYLPQSKALPNKSMITAIYSRYDYGWKLTTLNLGQYAINGKTAPELHKMAAADYNKGNLASAVDFMDMARRCFRPSDYWIYKNEDMMSDFATHISEESAKKYLFPFPIRQVSTEPLVIGVFSNTTSEGTFPVIAYQSKIKLANKAALDKEQQDIKKVIGNIMPGIDKNRKYLIYAAYNELPVSTKNVPRYEVKDKLQ